MQVQSLSSDMISTLPQNIIEIILCRLPIRDAIRTSILSKKWRHSWASIPELVFYDKLFEVSSNSKEYKKYKSKEYKKHKIVNAIFHVLLLHRGPLLHFSLSIDEPNMRSEIDQIILYLSTSNTLKSFSLVNVLENEYKLSSSFFSFQPLEKLYLECCAFEPPLTYNGLGMLRSLSFSYVEITAKMLQRLLINCPLAAGGMPPKLSTSLVHLKILYLDMCFMEQDELSSLLCLIRSAPNLEKIDIWVNDNQKLVVPQNFLDLEDYSSYNLNHLEYLVIGNYLNLPPEMEFVKLIMAKSPVLKKVQIKLKYTVSVDEELQILRDLLRHPFPCASPSAKFIIQR